MVGQIVAVFYAANYRLNTTVANAYASALWGVGNTKLLQKLYILLMQPRLRMGY